MIDLSFMAAAGSALTAAREFGKAALGIRDFNQIAPLVSQLNDQILKAQDALFGHQAQLLSLQQELIQAQEELRQAQKLIEDRGAYQLVTISPGVFVYQSNLLQHGAQVQVPHYLCQPCFDAGVKGVLVRTETFREITHVCPLCKTGYQEMAKEVQRVASCSVPTRGF